MRMVWWIPPCVSVSGRGSGRGRLQGGCAPAVPHVVGNHPPCSLLLKQNNTNKAHMCFHTQYRSVNLHLARSLQHYQPTLTRPCPLALPPRSLCGSGPHAALTCASLTNDERPSAHAAPTALQKHRWPSDCRRSCVWAWSCQPVGPAWPALVLSAAIQRCSACEARSVGQHGRPGQQLGCG